MIDRRALSRLRALILMAAAAVAATAGSLSEVSVDSQQNVLRGFLMMSVAGGDDPSPWPTWTTVRQTLDAANSLNTGGDVNGDRPPGFSLHPLTRRPDIAWAWWDGTDYEIVLSRWTGSQWSAWQQITDNSVDDLDPAISLGPDGICRVTWWRHVTTTPTPEENVWFMEALDGTADAWTTEELVTVAPRTGRRPDLVVRGGVNWIAFGEELADIATPDRHRVYVAQDTGNGWLPVRVGPAVATAGAGDARPDLRARIHAKKSLLWVDWVEDDGVLAWRVYQPQSDSWSLPQMFDFAADLLTAGNDAMAEEMARQRVERLVLAD